MDVRGLPGFRDFFPEDLALRQHIFSVWRTVASRYGFVEYDGPPLEMLELYTRKSGEEIVGQLYAFEDKGGREVALRPEMTPTFARMVSGRAGATPKPIRWYSIPQLFRYEKPQKGRLREHFQLNMDIVGEPDVMADADLIAAAIDVLRACGLGADDFVARVSDRRLMAGVLRACGIPAAGIPAAFEALDKSDRQPEAWLRERLAEAGASAEAADRVLELSEASLVDLLDQFGDQAEVADSSDRLARLFSYLGAFGLADYAAFDAGLVRGLAYYTGTVFELWDRKGEFRAICGGGRYDDLLAALGGADLPALGFGMGDVVLGEVLKARGLAPDPASSVDDFVICVGEDARDTVLAVVHGLRALGRRVTFDYAARGVGRQFKVANQIGAARAVVIGPDEAERREAVVRDMGTGNEVRVSLDDLLNRHSDEE